MSVQFQTLAEFTKGCDASLDTRGYVGKRSAHGVWFENPSQGDREYIPRSIVAEAKWALIELRDVEQRLVDAVGYRQGDNGKCQRRVRPVHFFTSAPAEHMVNRLVKATSDLAVDRTVKANDHFVRDTPIHIQAITEE
jgi:hypothetical protein